MHALWKKEIRVCARMRLENGREQTAVRGVAAEGEAVGGVGVVEEAALTTIVADVLETVDGAVGAE